jgi:hypothetical protein
MYDLPEDSLIRDLSRWRTLALAALAVAAFLAVVAAMRTFANPLTSSRDIRFTLRLESDKPAPVTPIADFIAAPEEVE